MFILAPNEGADNTAWYICSVSVAENWEAQPFLPARLTRTQEIDCNSVAYDWERARGQENGSERGLPRKTRALAERAPITYYAAAAGRRLEPTCYDSLQG